ncbi:MAG: response regulator transcription factor [Chitinophagaceae bacterium]|nr:response regulator transcription factor [Chitinophagaceae bacterium]
MKKIKVLVFEDHEDMRMMYEFLIQSQQDMELVASFPNSRNVLESIKQYRPDVILMDIQMPGMNGIETVRLLKTHFPELKIIMQTIFEDADRIFDSICAGASGYILKKSTNEDILQAIRECYAGGAPMTPVIALKVLDLFRKNNPQSQSVDFKLTDREKDILGLLVKGKSYKMIASELDISYHTVDAHIRKIYEKLHVHNATEAVSKAIENKIV